MFRLNNKLSYYLCSKCEISKNICMGIILHKNTLFMQDNNQNLKKTIYSDHNDAFDVFTNTLILDKMSKWRNHTFSKSIKLTETKLNSIFKFCDDPDHLITYLQQCLDGHCKVSENVLSQFMLTMTRHGRVNGLLIIEKLNEKFNYCIKKSELQINFAEAYWINGNLDNMFTILETIYPIEYTKINYLLEVIIYSIVKSHGVASIVMVIKFVNSIALNHKNYHPMCILWRYLFLSELYDDNLEAEKLMEQNSNLIEHLQFVVPVITNNMLKNHKINYVQRLMTMLLKYNKMELYQWVLKSLFEYYYTLRNVRQCKEIMKHSIELNVPLTQTQQSKLINMMFNNKYPQQINNEVTATIFKLIF